MALTGLRLGLAIQLIVCPYQTFDTIIPTRYTPHQRRNAMTTILIILLIVILIAGVPNTGWHSYGWGPSGIVGVILVVLLILMLLGRV